MKLPFRFCPASWGLRGTSYLRAEANYYLSGEALERRLIEIDEKSPTERLYLNLDVDLRYGRITKYEYEIKHLDIEFGEAPERLAIERLAIDAKHSKISKYEYDVRTAEILHKDEAELALAKLDIDLKHGKIDERKYNLTRATLNKEPYIAVIKSEYDPREGMNGLFFEFEWNELWIEYLRLNGYTGTSDEDYVEQWFRDLCRVVASEEPAEQVTESFPTGGPVINRMRRDGGTTEYS